jgi:hypothetical protein
MSGSESRHDKILNRVHLWVAVLGGLVTLTIGLYNFRSMIFPGKAADMPATEVQFNGVQTASVSTGKPLSFERFMPLDQNGDGKVLESEWKGARQDFYLLDLDGNGVLNAQDFKGTRFEDMDQNGDNVITRLEWRKTRRSFDMLDADGDGKISGDEFNARSRAAEA